MDSADRPAGDLVAEASQRLTSECGADHARKSPVVSASPPAGGTGQSHPLVQHRPLRPILRRPSPVIAARGAEQRSSIWLASIFFGALKIRNQAGSCPRAGDAFGFGRRPRHQSGLAHRYRGRIPVLARTVRYASPASSMLPLSSDLLLRFR